MLRYLEVDLASHLSKCCTGVTTGLVNNPPCYSVKKRKHAQRGLIHFTPTISIPPPFVLLITSSARVKIRKNPRLISSLAEENSASNYKKQIVRVAAASSTWGANFVDKPFPYIPAPAATPACHVVRFFQFYLSSNWRGRWHKNPPCVCHPP